MRYMRIPVELLDCILEETILDDFERAIQCRKTEGQLHALATLPRVSGCVRCISLRHYSSILGIGLQGDGQLSENPYSHFRRIFDFAQKTIGDIAHMKAPSFSEMLNKEIEAAQHLQPSLLKAYDCQLIHKLGYLYMRLSYLNEIGEGDQELNYHGESGATLCQTILDIPREISRSLLKYPERITRCGFMKILTTCSNTCSILLACFEADNIWHVAVELEEDRNDELLEDLSNVVEAMSAEAYSNIFDRTLAAPYALNSSGLILTMRHTLEVIQESAAEWKLRELLEHRLKLYAEQKKKPGYEWGEHFDVEYWDRTGDIDKRITYLTDVDPIFRRFLRDAEDPLKVPLGEL